MAQRKALRFLMSNGPGSAIQLSGVSKSYFGQSRVLDQISLEVRRGEFLYVLGGSGAGKSTLFRLISTEEASSAGQLKLFGYDLKSVNPSTLRAIRQAMGYVPQNIRLIPDLSVQDNIALSLSLAGRRALTADARTRMGELMERLALTSVRDRAAGSISGGEAQRVAVARALVRNPEIVIADEPTGMQDRDSTWSMMDLLVRANLGGATVLVATHDHEVVRRVRKRCAQMKAGRLAQIEPELRTGASPVMLNQESLCIF